MLTNIATLKGASELCILILACMIVDLIQVHIGMRLQKL